jgi:hypothetical protein
VDGEVEWGGGGGDTARRKIPVELFKAGDRAIALGKEGFATWWCKWCHVYKTEWQAADHQVGIPWNMESLKAHALRIESSALNLNYAQDVCGVKEQPLFDAVDTDHFVPPTLHLSIGKENDILENLIKELQAAGEACLANHYETEKNATLAILSLEKAKEEVQQFNHGHSEYKIDLQRQKRRRVGMIEDLRAVAEEELEDISLEPVGMQDAVDGATVFGFKEKAVCRSEEKGGELQRHRSASPCRD